jgi:hypothetical protein
MTSKRIVLGIEMKVSKGLAMSLIASILYPVDFSPSCVAMAAYVKRAAALLEARVSLIHVVDPTVYNGLQLYVRPIYEVSEEYLGSAGRDSIHSWRQSFLWRSTQEYWLRGMQRPRLLVLRERQIRSHYHAHACGHFPTDAVRLNDSQGN